jgi:hypothetical protein
MKENVRIYYYFIIGAIGGLTGWFFATIFGHFVGEDFGASILDKKGIFSSMIFGATLGSIIGIAVSAYDGISNRSIQRFLKFGSVGFLLGAVAGAISLPLIYVIYDFLASSANQSQTAGGGKVFLLFLIGTVCWLLFGGFIGLGEGVGKGTQAWKGVLGGMLGGLLGGILYEINRAFNSPSSINEDSPSAHFFAAVSLTLLGAAVSASVAFVTSALKSAWLEVLDGKLAGRKIDITKYVDQRLGTVRAGIIGSDEWSSHIYLPGDNGILSHHAQINYANGSPTITISPEAAKRQETYLNGRRLTHSSPLVNGDRIQIGSTNVIYRNTK